MYISRNAVGDALSPVDRFDAAEEGKGPRVELFGSELALIKSNILHLQIKLRANLAREHHGSIP